jgi:hypothetical protein
VESEWPLRFGQRLAGKFLVLGQKFSVAKTKSVLPVRRSLGEGGICAICGYFCAFESLWPILSFARYSSTPKVKKCKKSVQNMLKTCWFMLIFVQNARFFVNFLSIFVHFYPHF